MSRHAIGRTAEVLDKMNETVMKLVREIKNYMRPRVIVQIKPSKTSVNILNFEIKNVGNTTAFDISCRFDPDIVYYNTDLLLSQLPVFSDLSFLAPKEEIVFLFDSAIKYLNDPSKPRKIKAVLSYRDDADQNYEETFTINVAQLEKVLFAGERGVNDIVQELKRIERDLDRIYYGLRETKT